MKRAGRPLSQKSISNVEKLAHNSTLASFAEVADAMGIPLWVMFIEGLDFSLLEPPALQRLTQLVDDYRRCTDQQREYIEKMAAGYAGLNPEKKP